MSITLQWKTFEVPVDKLDKTLREILDSNYDGLICGPDNFQVVFKETPTQEETDAVTNFWTQVTQQQFSPTLRDIISGKINDAVIFGQAVILDAAVENVQMGVTQAGKTKAVADYCGNIQRYLQTGSLYAVLTEIDALIAAGVPPELSPFITSDRLLSYKTKVMVFLGLA